MKHQKRKHTKQPFLPGLEHLTTSHKTSHGGLIQIGKRKCQRPISINKSMHVILKSNIAKGALSLRSLRHHSKIEKYIKHFQKKFNVRVYKYSINSNHIHILLIVKKRHYLQNFLRALAGTIARKVKIKGKFWSYLAFSRIVEWGRDFVGTNKYINKNIFEAAGLIAYTPRRL